MGLHDLLAAPHQKPNINPDRLARTNDSVTGTDAGGLLDKAGTSGVQIWNCTPTTNLSTSASGAGRSSSVLDQKADTRVSCPLIT